MNLDYWTHTLLHRIPICVLQYYEVTVIISMSMECKSIRHVLNVFSISQCKMFKIPVYYALNNIIISANIILLKIFKFTWNQIVLKATFAIWIWDKKKYLGLINGSQRRVIDTRETSSTINQL